VIGKEGVSFVSQQFIEKFVQETVIFRY